MPARGKPNGQYQGSKWITRERRLAIYLRDGLACVYCAGSIEDGAILTLDHLAPYSGGQKTDSRNLVTACRRCNNSRGRRSLASFCAAAADYLGRGVTAAEIERHVRACARRHVVVGLATELIRRRGSYAAALSAAAEAK